MREHLRALLLLAVTTGVAALTGTSAPEGLHGFHLYPFGMLPLVLLQLPSGRRGSISVLTTVVTALTLVALGTPPWPALLYAVAGMGCAHLCVRVLRSDSPSSPTAPGSGWTLLVTATATTAVVLALTGLVATTGEPLDVRGAVLVACFVNAFGSFIAWLPLTRRQRSLPALAGPVERATQWIALGGATLLAFAWAGTASFGYVVLALLSWGALRLTWHEVVGQVLLVRLVATTLADHEGGPWAGVASLDLAHDVAPDLAPVQVQLFLITCSLCVVALSLSSARTRAETQRRAREDAQRVEQRLVGVVEELEAERTALKHMQEVDRLKDSLVSTVSHELRTPITNIIGYAEMLREGDYGDLSAPQGQAMTKIEGNSHRLLTLIDDLLTVSRLRSAGIGLDRASLDLVEVVRAAEETILPRVRSAGVSLEMDLPPAPVPATGDAAKLERVLVNLLSNAVKFTPRLGRITVRLREADGWALLQVADTGYGIPPEDLERLFSQFFRSSVAEDRHIQGTGLGLVIVQSIVEAHGGRVDVSSTVDVGTTFSVRLPLEPTPVPRPGDGTPADEWAVDDEQLGRTGQR